MMMMKFKGGTNGTVDVGYFIYNGMQAIANFGRITPSDLHHMVATGRWIWLALSKSGISQFVLVFLASSD